MVHCCFRCGNENVVAEITNTEVETLDIKLFYCKKCIEKEITKLITTTDEYEGITFDNLLSDYNAEE
jgi:transcription elongation factor Elf1